MELQEFIQKAREQNMGDEEIRHKLITAGWDADDVNRALHRGVDGLEVPAPPPSHGHHPHQHEQQPVAQPAHHAHQPMAVVENLSPRGFEYQIFALSFLASIGALSWLFNALIYEIEDGKAFPLTTLIVTAPIALFMFLRFQRAEKVDPDIVKDPSRRKSVQFIQFVTFLWLVIHTISFVYMFVSGSYSADTSSSYSTSRYYADDGPSIFKNTLSWLITILVAGGTFTYYWVQEHKRR